ncbi:twin-arginine translocase subunit TatC [Bacillus sp. FJAT-27445]|uniref:twin-arginine translocase subunit TatC n=1 Tax=Bacillus sp. FJAT-27445 TaxID=1679166 RepID=UPI0034623DC2
MITFITLLVLSYFTTPHLIQVLKESAESYGIELNIFKLAESISIYMKTMILQSVVFSIPFFLTQVYMFVKPALSKNTKIKAVVLIPIISVLFIIGASFGFKFLVPLLLSFFILTSAQIGVSTMFGFSDYSNFVFLIVFLFGSIFQLPILSAFLSYIKILDVKILSKYRKIAYLFLLAFSIIITPPDFISDIMVTSILFILYEISILLSRFVLQLSSKNPRTHSSKVNHY